MLLRTKITNNRWATILGLFEALLIWQQGYFPELLPRELAFLFGGGAIAGHGFVTNRKDCNDDDAEVSPIPQVVPVVELPPPPPPLITEPLPVPVDKFRVAINFTAKWEGGEVNHPNDPGGHTNLGVTQATYDQYRKSKGLQPRSVKFLNKVEAEAVYRTLFWDPARCDRCVLPLAVAYFDTCVNFGVNGGIRFLQDALGVAPDGRWGPESEESFQSGNNLETAQKLVESRIRYRHRRIQEHPPSQVFLAGWLNRDRDLAATISRL